MLIIPTRFCLIGAAVADTPAFTKEDPTQSRARATWDALLEAAAQLLKAGGLAAFNTNAVAMRAGASVGTLYQYFPSKDALMAALIAREQQARAANLVRFAAAIP